MYKWTKRSINAITGMFTIIIAIQAYMFVLEGFSCRHLIEGIGEYTLIVWMQYVKTNTLTRMEEDQKILQLEKELVEKGEIIV